MPECYFIFVSHAVSCLYCVLIYGFRGDLSALGQHHIPSVVITSIGKNAIVNDLPQADAITRADPKTLSTERLSIWLNHTEGYSAIASSKVVVLAVPKVRHSLGCTHTYTRLNVTYTCTDTYKTSGRCQFKDPVYRIQKNATLTDPATMRETYFIITSAKVCGICCPQD